MSVKTRSPKVSVTKNYRLFGRSQENRPLDVKKHRKLLLSMQQYGFLPCYPIVCQRNGGKELVIKDGQHRLMFAEKLGLPVYYIVEEVDFDVATINCTAKTWALQDYAQKHATNGKKMYRAGMEFAEEHKLPLGTAFALLSGTTTFSNVQESFVDGTFRIKDREWADLVASVYSALVSLSRDVRNARFMQACMAACRVEEFNPTRLIQNARRCRDKLVSYSTRDAYLDMLEVIYNFGRKELLALKVAATMAMRSRSAAPKR